MKNYDEIFMWVFYAFFGALLGILVYSFLGGWRYVFTGHARSTLIGPLGLGISLGAGAILGLISYWQRDREYGESFGRWGTEDPGGSRLFMKRLGVVIVSFIALYFIWQLAKGL